MIKQAWDYKSQVVSNKKDPLTKGKKLLSEYYYIDYLKLLMEGSEDAKMYFGMIMDFIAQDEFVKDNYYNFPTEVGDIISKIKLDNDYIYINDSSPGGSGLPDAAALAIRKYCKINTPDYYIIKAHVNDYVPVFLGTAIFSIPRGSGEPLVGDLLLYIKDTYQAIISALSPYFISEEEFWNEANIIENAETILNNWFSQE